MTEHAVSKHQIADTVLTMPVRIRRATQHMAMFSVDANAAQAMVDHSGLRVCRYRPGKAIAVLMLMHYVDGDLGQYFEYGTNVMVNPPGSHASGLKALQSAGAYVHHLPVDGAFTMAAGREIWGYPKVLAEFSIRSPGRSAPARRVRSPGRSAPARRVRSPGCSAPARRIRSWGRAFSFDVSIDGQFAVGMDFGRGLPMPSRLTSGTRVHPTYSCLDGITRETAGEMSMSGVRYRPGGARVRLGEHPYATELASLGFPKRAMFSSSADNVEMTFADAKEIS